VDRSADPVANRCPLLPWWKDFVQGIDRIRNLSQEYRRQRRDADLMEVRERIQAVMTRCAGSLLPILRVFGRDFLHDQIQMCAGLRCRPEDRLFEADLMRFRDEIEGGQEANQIQGAPGAVGFGSRATLSDVGSKLRVGILASALDESQGLRNCTSEGGALSPLSD
jgi:hypothetical protein